MITRYIKSPFWYGVGDTITGQVRKANEDNCGYQKTPNGELFVVCDGMGGHVGGATASSIAVDSIISYLSQQAWPDKPLALENALRFANTQILGTAANDPSLKGMGTTACVVLCDGADVWIGHVGDSRIYLYETKNKYLHRISKDHSYVQALVDKGELDDREAENHPNKNIIMRALGSKEDVVPEVEHVPLHIAAGDTFLICSDGLSGMVGDNEIENILSSNLSLEDKAEKLINEANAPGKGKDNITVQLIQAMSSTVEKSTFPDFNPKWRKEAHMAPLTQRKKRIIVASLTLAALILITTCGTLAYVHRGKINKIFIEWNKKKDSRGVNTSSGSPNTSAAQPSGEDGELYDEDNTQKTIDANDTPKTVDEIKAEATAYLDAIKVYKPQIDKDKKNIEELDKQTANLAKGIAEKDSAKTAEAWTKANENITQAQVHFDSITASIAKANRKLIALKATNVDKKIQAGNKTIDEYNRIKQELKDKNLKNIQQSIAQIQARKDQLAKELKNNSQNTKPESGSAQTEDNSATAASLGTTGKSFHTG